MQLTWFDKIKKKVSDLIICLQIACNWILLVFSGEYLYIFGLSFIFSFVKRDACYLLRYPLDKNSEGVDNYERVSKDSTADS